MASCFGTRHRKTLRIVKADGKTLVMKSPIKVDEILKSFPGSGISVSQSSNFLPLNHQLKLGNVYYLLPCDSNKSESETVSGVNRIKIVVTKKQLQLLMEKQLSVEDLLLTTTPTTTTTTTADSPRSCNWKPNLEAIPEGTE